MLLVVSRARAFVYFILIWTSVAEVLHAFTFYAAENDVNYSKSFLS